MSVTKQTFPTRENTILTDYEYKRLFGGPYMDLKYAEKDADDACRLTEFRASFEGAFLNLLETIWDIALAGRAYQRKVPYKDSRNPISEIVKPSECCAWDTLVEYCERNPRPRWPDCTHQHLPSFDVRWYQFNEANFILHALLKRCHDDVSLYDLDLAIREFGQKMIPDTTNRKRAVAELKAALPALEDTLAAVSRAFYAYEVKLKNENAIATTPAKIKPTPKSNTAKNKRGPKNTKFMQKQREAVCQYLDVECHRPPASVTAGDCAHIWNLPENKDDWNERRGRRDSRRGYSDCKALCNAVRRMANNKHSRRNG